jgi:hypothetical protein
VVFAEEGGLGGVAEGMSGLSELPPGAAQKTELIPNNQTVAKARMASRVNEFFNVLLGLVGCRWPSIGFRWRRKTEEGHVATPRY